MAVSMSLLASTIVTAWAFNDDVPVIPKDELPKKIDTEKIPIGFGKLPVAPADNPTTVEKAQLGRRLFFDPILSINGTVSCASCHQPDHGFASPDAVSVGIGG